MRLSKKSLTILFIVVGAISGVLLLLSWGDLLSSFAFIKPLADSLSGDELEATNFARYTSVLLFIMLSISMLGCAFMLFTKNRKFNIICCVLTILTILCAIIVCALATGYCYDSSDEILVKSAAIMTAFQAQIMPMIILLTVALAIQVFATFNSVCNSKSCKRNMEDTING